MRGLRKLCNMVHGANTSTVACVRPYRCSGLLARALNPHSYCALQGALYSWPAAVTKRVSSTAAARWSTPMLGGRGSTWSFLAYFSCLPGGLAPASGCRRPIANSRHPPSHHSFCWRGCSHDGRTSLVPPSHNVENAEGMLPSSKEPQREINPYPSPILY